MPDTILQQKIFPYDGGQDATKNPILISPKDVVESNNLVYTTYSTKKLRPGVKQAFTHEPSGNRKILGGYDFWRYGKQYIVYYDGQRIRTIDPLTNAFDDITGNNVLPIDESVTFVAFQGLLLIFFGGGQTPVKAWLGSGNIFDLIPPGNNNGSVNAPFGIIWLNSLWMPDISLPGRLVKSATGDPTDFLGGDAAEVDLDLNDGDPDGITAIFPPFFGSIYVAKRLSVFRVSLQWLADGSTVLSPTKISDGVGCISHNGVVAVEQNIFFPSDYGWHTFQSTNKLSAIDTELLSVDIQPLWTSDTNFKRSKYIRAHYDRTLNSILCMFPAASYNYPTDIWGFSLVAKKWYRWQEFEHSSMWNYIEKDTKRLRTMVGSNGGRIGYLDEQETADYGKRFGCSLQSGLICPSGAPDDQFAFNHIAPLFVPQAGGSFTVTYKIDGRTIETKTFSMRDTSLGDELGIDFITGQSVLGGIPQIKFVKTRIKGYGMIYQVFIEYDPSLNETSVVEGEDQDRISFELLGLFVDVSSVSKGTGERVA